MDGVTIAQSKVIASFLAKRFGKYDLFHTWNNRFFSIWIFSLNSTMQNKKHSLHWGIFFLLNSVISQRKKDPNRKNSNETFVSKSFTFGKKLWQDFLGTLFPNLHVSLCAPARLYCLEQQQNIPVRAPLCPYMSTPVDKLWILFASGRGWGFSLRFRLCT